MDGERENRSKKIITEIPTEFRLEPWPTLEEYKLTKTDFMNENLEQMYSHLKTDLGNFFKDLTDIELHKAAELISTFQFGAFMVYKRLGFKHELYAVNIDPSNRKQYQFMGYEMGHDIFHIKKGAFFKLIKDSIKKKQLYDWNGIESVTVNEIFEISGVEEGAHFIFDKEKQRLGRDMYKCWAESSTEKYYSSEVEYRALIWKSAYVRRYMPQFYKGIQKTIKLAEDYMHREI